MPKGGRIRNKHDYRCEIEAWLHDKQLTAPTALIECCDKAIGVAHLLHHLFMFKSHIWFLNWCVNDYIECFVMVFFACLWEMSVPWVLVCRSWLLTTSSQRCFGVLISESSLWRISRQITKNARRTKQSRFVLHHERNFGVKWKIIYLPYTMYHIFFSFL